MTLVRRQERHDTAANWTTANPVLAAGELGVETDSHKLKAGDGATAWADLPYAAGSSSGGSAPTVASSSYATGSGYTATVAYPAGITAGDLLVAVIACNYETQPNPAAGWSLAARTAGSMHNTAIVVRLADGTESGSVGFAMNSGHDWVAFILRVSGVNRIVDFASVQTGSGPSSLNTPPIRSVAGALLLQFGSGRDAGTLTTTPAGAAVATASYGTVKALVTSAAATVAVAPKVASSTAANGLGLSVLAIA